MFAVVMYMNSAKCEQWYNSDYCKHKSRLILHCKQKNSEQRTAHHLYELQEMMSTNCNGDLFLSRKQENVINTETNGAFSG